MMRPPISEEERKRKQIGHESRKHVFYCEVKFASVVGAYQVRCFDIKNKDSHDDGEYAVCELF